MAVVASVLFLGLLMMKVVLAISTVLVFIGMPIAIVLWPVMPVGRARARPRVRGVPRGAARLVDVLRGERRDAQRRPVSEGVLGVLRRAARAAGGDRAAVDHAAAADQARADGDARRERRWGAGSSRARSATRPVRSCATSRASTCRAGRRAGPRGASEQRPPATDSRLGARLGAESVLAASKAAAGGATRRSWRRRGRGRRRSRTGAPVDVDGRGSAAAGGAAANGASNGSTGQGSGWLGRVRGAGKSRAYSPPPLAGNQATIAARRRATATELAPRGLRRGDARGVAARAAPAGVGRAGPAGARGAAGEHPGGDWARWSPTTARGRGSTSPIRRSASGRRSSARRSARWRRRPPRCGRRRSPMAAASTAGFGDAAEPPPARTSAQAEPQGYAGDRHECAVGGRGRPRRPANGENGATKPREAQDQPPSSEGDR